MVAEAGTAENRRKQQRRDLAKLRCPGRKGRGKSRLLAA
jgi:hypothetical protein